MGDPVILNGRLNQTKIRTLKGRGTPTNPNQLGAKAPFQKLKSKRQFGLVKK